MKGQKKTRARPLAIAYLRVSTTEQVEDGASLDAQRQLLGQEAERRGWDVEYVADEGYSAKSVEGRPGLEAALSRVPVPMGFSIEIGGDWEEQTESFAMLVKGFILAIVLMYMVMASQFESLRDPLLILLTLPIAAVGVLLVLVFWDTTLNVQSFIGLIVLAGVVVNNAIVLVDYFNQLKRAEPQTEQTLLIQRASVRRFRPIVMTTLTTVLGMLPVALALGEGSELQAPMARVVIGGLVSGTIITLVAIPVVLRLLAPAPASPPPVSQPQHPAAMTQPAKT